MADTCLPCQPMGTVHAFHILDSLMATYLVHNTAVYTVYGRCVVYTDRGKHGNFG